jgi:hypothetical protein
MKEDELRRGNTASGPPVEPISGIRESAVDVLSRTEIACISLHCGHLTLSVSFQRAWRLCTSASMPVGARLLVRVSHFMNRFRELGYIDYNGNLKVHSSLLDAVLHEKPPQIKIPK